ncbi:helix-turn-helix domain-containing protein [Actinocorallia populi]|uniref:helix-turn-helix domain-containing protein n=1 Tax=Actinocorallia populi TaxID=2079200 RepID=UPI001300A8F4|nr:helix-turn-helix transcriptional regulator [Actinocorallia populi]
MAQGELARDPLIRAFGAVVRTHREAAGLSRAKLADALGCSPQWIEKIETGARPPSEATAIDLDTYFKTPGVLHAMWKEIKRSGKAVELPPGFPGFMVLESKARVMSIFENMTVTGLFQTPDYAYEILSPGRGKEAIEEVIQTRLERQKILTRRNPPEIVLVLDETALHRPIGDAALRRKQLDHLASLAESPNITVQVVPKTKGSYAGIMGTFTLMEFDDGPHLVYTEGHIDGHVIDHPEKVMKYGIRFSLIRSAAMSADDSLNLIRAIEGTL